MNQGKNVGFNFFQVRCAHKSGDVINFIIVACRITSQLKWYKNYKNRLRLAKVIVKNKMSRFYGSLCILLNSKHGLFNRVSAAYKCDICTNRQTDNHLSISCTLHIVWCNKNGRKHFSIFHYSAIQQTRIRCWRYANEALTAYVQNANDKLN